MAISRYKDAVEFINATEGYKKTFKNRYGEKGIRQFSYGTLTYPTQEDFRTECDKLVNDLLSCGGSLLGLIRSQQNNMLNLEKLF